MTKLIDTPGEFPRCYFCGRTPRFGESANDPEDRTGELIIPICLPLEVMWECEFYDPREDPKKAKWMGKPSVLPEGSSPAACPECAREHLCYDNNGAIALNVYKEHHTTRYQQK